MLWLNGRLPSWRPRAPLGLVAGLAGTPCSRPPVAAPPCRPGHRLGGVVSLAASGRPLRILVSAPAPPPRVAAMHLAYGAGSPTASCAAQRPRRPRAPPPPRSPLPPFEVRSAA